jgi:imidazoleglycerol-phosphate dehydratase
VLERKAIVERHTRETDVSMTLDLDGSGKADICTGIRLFDHLLEQLVRHGRLDVTVAATGDDAHHLVEDVAIVLGQCLNQALGEKRGITRMVMPVFHG